MALITLVSSIMARNCLKEGYVYRKLSAFVVVMALLVAIQPIAFARPVAQAATTGDPRAKIHSKLWGDISTALAGRASGAGQGAASRGGDPTLAFMARIVAGTDLSAYAQDWFARPFVDPLGATVAVGRATPAALLKLASMPEVLTLQRPESNVVAPAPADADLETTLNAKPQIHAEPTRPGGPAPEGWYHTGSVIHGSQAAWERGYTGEGVRHMVNDSGADYCHPDLIGTWAYIDDPASPYVGLPQMFDSWTSYLAARDFYLDETNIADGATRSQWADTSATAAGNFSYAPLGATAAHNYTVPGTSRSGEYHYGSHPDNSLAANASLLSINFGDGSAVDFERAAILVVDETTAGVYDTVYVDLNYNYDFRDDTPARLTRDFTNQEIACLDYNDDGLNDISGGLVFFISDGETAVPTLDWYWGVDADFYGNGDLVAFHVMDFIASPGGNHGMGCTSVAAGQGVVRGSLVFGPDGNPVAGNQGLVVGPGKDVGTTQNGDFYITPFIEDAYVYAGLGYDSESGTGDDVQIVSNSWGFSDVDNDSFDLDSRLIDLINRSMAPNTTILFSTGNGAAGYGTNAPPSPPSGMGVGASTLFGSTGEFEAIDSANQILGGDAMSWSNRGPGPGGSAGVDILGTGAFGTGSIELNAVLDGSIATLSFGGTSMAAPVVAGNLALIYQAWKDATGEWPTFAEAKALAKSTAKNAGHDIWSQGAGLIDADRGTLVASGEGGFYASPAQWAVGDYRGAEYDAFAQIIRPGRSDTQTFTLHNPSDAPVTVRLSTNKYREITKKYYALTSLDQSLDHGLFTTPDYVFRIDQDIPPGTALLQVTLTKPYDQFDPDGDTAGPYNNWRIHLQNWTDLNGDGKYWVDVNGNGKVDATGEMQTGEHNRFTYGYNVGPTQQARIANPLQRIDDGLLMTFRHRNKLAAVPTTNLRAEATYYRRSPWLWASLSTSTLTIPAGGSASFTATVRVPSNVPTGMYDGQIIVTQGGHETALPVTVAVAATGGNFTMGVREYTDYPYDNSRMFGFTDYTWRAESGDWRFFLSDIRAADLPRTGTPFLVVDNRWRSPGTDIDTIILGPTRDFIPPALTGGEEGVPFPEAIYGPYTLGETGRSVNAYLGSGRWGFQTSSGGPRELVASPAIEGLHAVMLHQVKVDGARFEEPFRAQAGFVTLNPATVSGSGATGSARFRITSDLLLEGFGVAGYGFSAPVVTRETVNQDDPNDPSTASFSTTFTVSRGASLTVSTGGADGSDLDLYVLGPDGSLIGASTSPTDVEEVTIQFPEDGTYTILVHGFSVPGGSTEFDLAIDAVQGSDISAVSSTSFIRAGGSGQITVSWDLTGRPAGTYRGLVVLGPRAAPGLLAVPVEVVVP